MRLTRDDSGLRLVSTARERQLIDMAFEHVLNRSPLDDWRVRTGASRDELWTVWFSLAAKRSEPEEGGPAGAAEGFTEISERAVEVLEAVLFEIARARLVPEWQLEALTGASMGEWRELWRRAREIVAEAWVQPVRDDSGERALLPTGATSGNRELVAFRQLGGSLTGAKVEGAVLEIGDIRAATAVRCAFRDVTCRGLRLIDSRFNDCSISGTFESSSVIDCDLDGVSLTGTLSDVRFVGNAYRVVDLRSAMLLDCHFYDVGPEGDARLPDGRDCFVVCRRTIPHAFATMRAPIGEATLRALARWYDEEDAEFVSIAAPFWRGQIVGRGGAVDPELEAAVIERLFRMRCVTLA